MKKESSLQKVDNTAAGLTKQEAVNQDIMKQEAFSEEIIESRISFFNKIFPSAETKVITEYRKSLITVVSNSKVENVRMVKEAERQVLKEALELVLKQGKVKTRGDFGRFFETEMEDYLQTMSDISTKFWDKFVVKKAEIEKIPYETARKGRLQELKEDTEIFQRTMTKLKLEFENILNEGV